MIARSLFLFLLLIIIPDVYFDMHYWRHHLPLRKRILRWLPSVAMVIYTVIMALERNFIPEDPTFVYIYLLLLGLLVIPKFFFMLCSITGFAYCHHFHKKKNYGNLIGLLAVPVFWYIVLYGSFVGFNKLEVNRHTYVCKDIPEAFNGYKIALFSDAHVGSYKKNNQWVLQRAIDSINAQKPDMIIFTGDLQNIEPKDLYRHMDILSSLKAKDGVYSILGNHDYAEYISGDAVLKTANCRETISLERQMGWTLLLNESLSITRGDSHIILAGMENDGDGKHFPQKGDIKKTLKDVESSDFIIMLEHDPSCWRRKIIPDGRSQLTLSGHTHAMQFKLGDWSPMALKGTEWNGLYKEGKQQLYVTAGVGGVVPWRFGATGEVVVITLRKGQ